MIRVSKASFLELVEKLLDEYVKGGKLDNEAREAYFKMYDNFAEEGIITGEVDVCSLVDSDVINDTEYVKFNEVDSKVISSIESAYENGGIVNGLAYNFVAYISDKGAIVRY